MSRTLVDLFTTQVEQQPEAIAVVHGDERLTYRELHERSDHVAHCLLDFGARGSRVGLLLARSIWVPVAVLGVLKAGCSYVPLDPDEPAAQLRRKTEDAGVDLVLTNGAVPLLACEVASVEKLVSSRRARALPAVHAEDDAYVLYPPGSTGGVRARHAEVVTFLEAAERDCWTLSHLLCSADSVREIWGALAHGGQLVI